MILNSDKMIIGYDLSYQYAQISYCRLSAQTPETFAVPGQAKQYNIPLCLFKRKDVNQWFLGKEAKNFSQQEEGTLIENLLQNAIETEEIEIAEESFESIALLALFVKRSLYMPGKECKPEKVSGIMFTVPFLNEKMIEILQKLSVLLNLPNCRIYFQSREESIYHYIIHQPKELWSEDVLVYDSGCEELRSYRFTKNINTRPMVAFVEEAFHGGLNGQEEEKDARFLQVVQETADFSCNCAFLIGEGFHGEWCQDSLRLLCTNRRVFKGNDLYSKGACFAMQERIRQEPDRRMVFLGKDKLKINIGMDLLRQGENSYLAVLDGGESWYECKKEWDSILKEGNQVIFKITPLDGRDARYVEVLLDVLPKRDSGMTRLHLKAVMKNETMMEVMIEDMGFGEFEPSSQLTFSQQIDLSLL